MIIQILTEKSISSNVWIAEPLNMADLSFFSFLRDLHTDHPLVASTYTKNIQKDWMGLDIGVIHPIQTSGSEVRAIKGLEIGGLTSARNSAIPYKPSRHVHFAKLLGYV